MPEITPAKTQTQKTPQTPEIHHTHYTETHLKKLLYKTLKPFLNCYHRKLSNPFRAGILDFYILFEGRSVWLELKILPNKLTPLQKNEIQAIQRAGGFAYGVFAEPDLSAFYLYRKDFDIIEYGDLITLLKGVLL